MPELSKRITGLVNQGGDGWGVHYRAQNLRASGIDVTMLSVGDHDIKTAPAVLEVMTQSAIGGNLGYTSVQGDRKLREAIASRVTRNRRIGATAQNIVVTPGGQGAIFSTMMAVLDAGNSCIVMDPFYASFDITVRAAGGEAILVPTPAEHGFQLDPKAIEAAIRPDTRAILINTPNNPTGAVYERSRLEAVAEICKRHDLWLISDELYDSQVFDGDHISPRDLPDMVERTIVIGSMSKGFAMTGARIGWAVGPVHLIEKIVDLAGATTYGLPGFIQDASTYALTDNAEQEAEVAARYQRRREIAVRVMAGSNQIRMSPPSGGMYVMLDVRATGLSGIGFAEQLLDAEHIAVMPGESFGRAAAGHVRVAMTVSDSQLEDALQRLLRFGEQLIG